MWSSNVYLGIKVVHILAFVSWMAGLLYLIRIYINIVENRDKHPDVSLVLMGMADRLYRIITSPAMIVTWIAGILMLATNQSLLSLGAMHVKLVMVFLLSGFTGYSRKLWKNAKKDLNSLPDAKKLRIINEVPTVIMIIVVIMIIYKPF